MAKPKKAAKTKMNIPMCLASVLFCLTLFSFHLSGGVVARYTATATGFDTARVAKFGNLEVATTGATLAPGVTSTWSAVVDFTSSEMATYVFVEVDTKSSNWKVSDHSATNDKRVYNTWYHDHDGKSETADVPGLTWVVADGWTYLPPVDGESRGTNTYVYYRELPVNTPLDTSVVKDDGITVAPTLPTTMLSNIQISFAAHAVQSNGFGSALEAWESLSTKHT